MAMTSVSVMMTVFVLNLHYRGPKKNEVPFWIQQLLSLSLANFVRTFRKRKRFPNASKTPIPKIQMKVSDETPPTSKRSRLASSNGVQFSATCPNISKIQTRLTTDVGKLRSGLRWADHLCCFPFQITSVQIETNEIENRPERRRSRLSQPSREEIRLKDRPMSRSSSTYTIQDEIQETLHSLLRKQKELEHDQQVINDWRVMATKIDKILFYVFLFLTIVSTLGLLVVAPMTRTNVQQKRKLWNGSRRP